MTTYDLTFTLTTTDSLELRVTAQDHVQAVDNAINQLSQNLNANQILRLTNTEIVQPEPLRPHTDSNGYTSLSNLYATWQPAPEPVLESSLPEIPSYNRLVN